MSVVILDHRIADADVITRTLPADARLVILNGYEDGVRQIVAALRGVRDQGAIHIVSHGADGRLLLGATTLDTSNLADYEFELASIGASLADDGDLLLYGCEVAQSAVGRSFVEAIARLTHANVAASTNRTGAAALGGDWRLQFSTGPVATDVFLDATAQAAYAHVLPAPNPFELLSLNGTTGFKLSGVAVNDLSGASVTDAGDVNGDGYDDLIVGAFLADPNGTDSGASYVVFGKASGFASNLNLSALDGSNGFKLSGVAALDRSGRSVGSAGDVNGDGYDDLIVGAFLADPNGSGSGASYVVLGKASGFAANLNLSALNGTTGFKLSGVAAGDYAGISVSSAGDVNGDGYDDLIVGAYRADPNGTDSGASYVVFGKASGFASNFNLSTLDGTNGFKFSGAALSNQAGVSVSNAGDVNGDGYADVIVGAFGATPNGNYSGASYVVFGKASGFASNLNLSTLDGTTGFKLSGVAASDQAGISVSSAGDVNGDGYDDIIVGALYGDGSVVDSGAAYVVFGKASGFVANLNLSALDGTTGFKLSGVAASDQAGVSVSTAGDVNGDGFDDLLVGADLADPHGSKSGASYVVFGKASGFAANLNLSALDGTIGFKLSGVAAGDYAGAAVSGAGDINGDGYDDLIVGARYADANGADSGASYVIFGGNFTGAVTFLGTNSADTLNAGTTAAETFVAAQGNDTITTGGGADVVNAGEGNDRIVVPDLAFRQIDGGSGIDTLALSGSGLTLDLTTLANNRLGAIEVIDLTGSGNNTLKLTAAEVLTLSDSSNTLRVDGNAGDLVLQIGTWVVGSTTVIGSDTYRLYTQGAATLQVDIDVGMFTSDLTLSSLTGTNGFKLSGVAAGDQSGFSVGNAGDVNGDGYDDLIVGARYADPNGNASGASYVVFGKSSAFGSNINLSVLDGATGFKLSGVAGDDRSGTSVSSAGDVNGDGFGDLLVGALWSDTNGTDAGASYVVFGKSAGFAANLNLSTLNGTTGFRLLGAFAGDQLGITASSAGDVNGDGYNDLIVGAHLANPNGGDSGASFVVFGKASGFASSLDLSTLDGTAGFKLSGVAVDDQAGFSVSDAGDVNGDGYDDLIVGARYADANALANAGASYVVFGKVSGFAANLNLSALDGTTGFKLSGVAAGDQAGFSVSSAGDVNGDGYDDLIVGARYADPNGISSGASYVVFGKGSGFAANLNLSTLDGTSGFKLSGAAAANRSGSSVSSAGDVNGDGYDDLIVGAYLADPNGTNAGAGYVVFGKASWVGTSNLNLSALDGATGFRLAGAAAGEYAGRSVSAAGDVNGDGFDDLIVGAYGADPNGTDAGASYVIFGGNFTGAVTYVGTNGADVLDAGTTAAETFVAGQGNDTIWTRGGADVVNAGAGDDRIVVSDLDFKFFDGGSGFDRLTTSLTLDLTTIANNRLAGIEAIDLTDHSKNNLKLAAADVLALSDSSNTLRVNGDPGDVVVQSGTWVVGGTTVIGSDTYRLYTQGAATLQIDTDVGVTTPDLPLSALNGINGFKLSGVAASDQAGISVSNAGDVNGDGYDDLIVGARYADPNGTSSGASYVVFGKASGFGANLELSTLDGAIGFKLSGVAADDRSGSWVSDAGDLNGDGYADVVVGAVFADPNGLNSGASYVVFGKASGFAANLNLSALDGITGFKLSGVAAGDRAGISVSHAGDVNGDGYDDLIVGANGVSGFTGAAYVVFGKASGYAANINPSALDGTIGFKLSGVAAGDTAGRSVSSAGDVNGDGYDDVIVGATSGDGSAVDSGTAYVVYGKASGFAANVNLSALDGTTGFKLSGVAADDRFGTSVSSAGDVNGDGYDDLIVGAYLANSNAVRSGAAYVVFGKAPGFGANLNLSALDGTNGFKLSGVAIYDHTGFSVSSAGDINGDGYDDLIAGAMSADPNGNYSGTTYVVFGKSSGFTANINLAALDGTTGFRLSGGVQFDFAGRSVSRAGDVDGDGYDDLIVGAYGADANGNDAGASYVIFGGNFTGAVTYFGTNGADVLNAGTTAAETFIAAQGNDTITTGGGADVVNAGAGNDRIVVGDLAFRQIDGGSGTDTLALSGSGMTLDLTTLANNRLGAIEVIDLTGSGNNTLKLTAADVLTLSDSSNTLRVDGNAGDIVLQIGNWVAGTTTVIGNETYRLYTQGAATLQIDTDVFVRKSELQLSSLNGTNGFKLSGVAASDQAGLSVADAGDINGDGYGDLIVGASYADPNGLSNAGASYVVFGKASGFASAISLSALDGSAGFRLAGAEAGDYSGRAVSTAGDVNGDGYDDIAVGAWLADPIGLSDAGASYVVFGKASGFASSLSLGALNGTTGFRLAGAAPTDFSGRSLSTAGDVNGDGYDDLIVGAVGSDSNGNGSGASYVVFGKASGFTSNLDLAVLDGSNGFRLLGAAVLDQAGDSVSSAGDVNGDGFDDLIVGAFNAYPGGASYVVFGKASGFASTLALGALDGSNGVRLDGPGDQTGLSVSGAGDVNGDGYDDLIVGTYFAGPNGTPKAGASYVVFGKASGYASTLDLGALDGATGFRIAGAAANDYSSFSVSGAGDVNGDGYDDLIVSAPFADINGESSGASYVVFGKASGFASSLALGALDGTDGFRIAGVAASDFSGTSVSGAGDVNGDGYDDLIVGAKAGDGSIADTGAAYVIFGGNFTGTVTPFLGTRVADTLIGTSGADTLIGARGNDTLDGGGGIDRMVGGEGNDTYVVDSYADIVIDTGGIDLVQSSDNYTLVGRIENLTLTGTADVAATGNGLANVLTGNSGHNVLRGNGGDDLLIGGAGYDTAAYTGSLGQYAFVDYLGSIRVVDRVRDRDGLDITQNVEQARFAGNVDAVFTASDVFTPLEYIASYSDLMGGFGANAQLGYDHFANTGRYALRSASFDGLEYLASQPDLLAGLPLNADAAATHYIQSGRFEGRTVSFNGLEYLASYSDLINSFGVNEDLGTNHYLTAGRSEGRTVTFRGLEYLASNPDLMAGYGANFELATIHYISSGRFEGRVSSFHALEYIASYADLIQGIGANINAGALHYINSGRFEGRTEHFDAAQYLANYADLAAGFGGNHELAAIHYIQHGFYEGRTDHPL